MAKFNVKDTAIDVSNLDVVEHDLKIENGMVYGLEPSIIRSKYPMAVDTEKLTSNVTKGIETLMKADMGTGHDNFLNGVIVQFDLTIPNKMWTELQRYHFIDYVSSQSTIHCMTKFDVRKQYDSHVDPAIVDIMEMKVYTYNMHAQSETYDKEKLKEEYLDILMSNPAGFMLTAGMTTNYRQLKTIYYQRKNHKLPQWRKFCKWIEQLPMMDKILK